MVNERPGVTGVAHLFERWPSRGGTIQATSSVVVGEVITAETITTETARGSTCDVLEVATSAGTERVELRS